MSGGSYEYAYFKVESMVATMEAMTPSPLRAAFAKHLMLVAKAMHDIEWVDSGDYGPGDEDDAIKAALGSSGWEAGVRDELGERCDELRREIDAMGAP